jgi:hypothetical protein
MLLKLHIFASFCLILFLAAACESVSQQYLGEKIDGVCFVAPRDSIPQDAMVSIQTVEAGWVAIVPYAFSHEKDPKVNYDTTRQWWGETKRGVEQTIQYAKNLGMKVMLKPHVWIVRQGWPGDYDLESEEQWQEWEQSYTDYLDLMTDIAIKHQVELICIGTEFRVPARERPDYWRSLIRRIRARYDGQLTYAANWDNYENVKFWDELDFIGIDAYFPVTDQKNPSLRALIRGWEDTAELIEEKSEEYAKPVLFTEYGYRSADFASRGHWENERDELVSNPDAQARAYEALYETFWNKPWFAGGFLWKWYPYVNRDGRWNRWETDFTPQEKPAAEVIRRYYGR